MSGPGGTRLTVRPGRLPGKAARALERCTRNESEPKEGIALDCPSWREARRSAALARWRQSMRSRGGAALPSSGPVAVVAGATPAGTHPARARAAGERRYDVAARARTRGAGAGRACSPARRVERGLGGESNTMRLAFRVFLSPITSAGPLAGQLWRSLENLFLHLPDSGQVGSWSLLLPRLRFRPPGQFVVTGLSGLRARCITWSTGHFSNPISPRGWQGCPIFRGLRG